MYYWDSFVEWASRPENSSLVQTLVALIAIPGALAGAYLFWRRVSGHHPEAAAAVEAQRFNIADRRQRILSEISDVGSDLYAKVAAVIYAHLEDVTVPEGLVRSIRSQAQRLHSSLGTAVADGLSKEIISDKKEAEHLYRLFVLVLEEIASSSDLKETQKLCLSEQFPLGLIRLVDQLFSQKLISKQYIADQFKSDADPSGLQGLNELAGRAWRSS